MTPDLMRQGAALVRALVEGDETVRGPLSDFAEEYGLPMDRTISEGRLRRAADILRKGPGKTHAQRGHDGCCYVFFADFHDGYLCWLGTWPAWAWDGSEVQT